MDRHQISDHIQSDLGIDTKSTPYRNIFSILGLRIPTLLTEEKETFTKLDGMGALINVASLWMINRPDFNIAKTRTYVIMYAIGAIVSAVYDVIHM